MYNIQEYYVKFIIVLKEEYNLIANIINEIDKYQILNIQEMNSKFFKKNYF